MIRHIDTKVCDGTGCDNALPKKLDYVNKEIIVSVTDVDIVTFPVQVSIRVTGGWDDDRPNYCEECFWKILKDVCKRVGNRNGRK